MRNLTLTLATIALAFSGAALAGGEYGKKESGMKAKDKQSADMAVEKIDRANAVQTFNNADEDSDFKLTKREAANIRGLEKKFAKLDSDGDGALDYDEFRSLTRTGGDKK